jgi:hypothetical protein
MALSLSRMERLPREDHPQRVAIPQPPMKDNLGPRFHGVVVALVSWFMGKEDHLNPKVLWTAVEEVLYENGNMSDLALQTAIRERYARKINAVLQKQALPFNPEGPGTSKLVTRFKFAPLTEASDIRLFKFSKFITLGAQTAFSCETVHAILDENPVYTAVSYVWGNLGDDVPVLVGEDHFLMVTRNLMEVLFRFSGCNNPREAGNTIRLL